MSALLPSAGTPQPDMGNNALPGATQRAVFTQIPGGPHPSDFLDKINYRGVSDLGNTVATIATDRAKEDAAQQGAQAVVRDPKTGELTVEYKPEVFAWDKAYNDAASKSYVAQASGDVRTNAFTIAQANPGDPVAFQNAFSAWSKGYIAKAPAEVRGDLSLTASQEASRFTEGIFQNKAKADIADAQTALKTEYETNTNQLYALARQGGEGTPDFVTALDRAKAATDKMVANPLFGYSKEDQTRDLAELNGGLQAQSIIGHAVTTGQMDGEQAGLDLLDKAIWDPKLPLTPAQRSTFAASGRAEIRENAQASREKRTEDQQQILYGLDDTKAYALDTGRLPSTFNPDRVVSAFGKYHGAQIIEGMNAAAAIGSMRKNVATATPAQLAQMNASLDPGNVQAPTAPSGFDSAWAFTLPHEGGYSPHDANGAPVNFGINQAAHPNVDVSKLTPDTAKPIAKSDYWDLVGADNLPANMQAAAFDTAYIFGPKTAKAMVDQSGGDPNKLIDIREQAMQAMIARDPAKFGKYQQAWERRNDDLRAFANGAGGDGYSQYAAKKQEHDAFIQAVTERNRALVKDPSGYVASNRPDVAAQLVSDKPDVFQNGMRSLIQIQRDMGLVNPQILSKPYASQIVQQFDNPEDPAKRADGMNKIINGLQARYGSYFPQVMKELQASGLPPEANALYQVRGLGGVAYRMATAINSMQGMGGKSVNENRDTYFKNAPNNSEIGKAIPGTMDDYVQSFRGNPEGPQQVAGMGYSVALYARQLSYEGVTDPDAAAKKAHDDLIGSRYHFVDGYRVPTGVDDSMVKRGADAVRALLPAELLEPHGGAVAGVDTKTRQDVSRDILRTRGVWVTRSDDKGLYLAWPADAGYRPVLSHDGKPLSFSWAQLQEAAKNPNALNATADQQDRSYLGTGGH